MSVTGWVMVLKRVAKKHSKRAALDSPAIESFIPLTILYLGLGSFPVCTMFAPPLYLAVLHISGDNILFRMIKKFEICFCYLVRTINSNKGV